MAMNSIENAPHLCYTAGMANVPVNPHDAFFKQYLSHPSVAADFLRQHLPRELANLLDLTQLHLEKDSFVDEQLRSHFSDLVYRAMTTTATPLAIALLFEHKSYPDEWVDFQILRYAVNIWVQQFEQLQALKKAEKLPETTRQKLTPLLVLLVYHGQAEWKVSLRFARHLAGMEDPDAPLAKALARYVPDFEPYFVNLTAISDEEIRGEVVTRLFVLVLKHIAEHGLGGHLDEILTMAAEIMRQPSGLEMVIALLRYIGRSGIKVTKEEVARKLLELLPKEGGVLMETMAQEWIEEGKQIGFKEGRDEGRKEGRDEGRKEGEVEGVRRGRREMIMYVLRRRFLATTKRLTAAGYGSSETLLQQIEALLEQIKSDEALNQLVDSALSVLALPDFLRSIEAVLPSTSQ